MKVLVVEDDAQLGEALATGLRQLQHVVDWFRDYPDSADWERGPLGHKVQLGTRRPTDPSYRLLQLE